jgi:PmbA protein
MAENPLEQIARNMVERAAEAGATATDAVVREGEEFSTVIRLGKIESLKEASSKALGLRVFQGTRSASAYSSDFSEASLQRLVQRTLAMTQVTSEDPANGLPDPGQMGRYEGDLQLYSDDVRKLSTDERVSLALRAEEAALGSDPRIQNSEGATFEASEGEKAYASSSGFVSSYRASYCGLTVVPIARNGQKMQRDYWYSVARAVEALEPPEAVGRKAAERTLRRLGARKISSCHVPVVFDPETARSLLGHLFEAVRGDAIYRQASFLAGKLGQRIASDMVTVLDDGLRPAGFGSRPFDDEGIAACVTPVVENGVLRNYLLNCYAARKLGMTTTGNAMRGIAGPPGVGPKNFYLAAGRYSPQEIIQAVPTGFYVTDLMGFGVNLVTGDYSRGAAGLWIENGELTYPVEEITLAGNLAEMFTHISMVGRDLEFRGALVAPTLLIEGLAIAGT